MWSTEDKDRMTAFDAVIGPSPHFAAVTNFGIFCPACSNPLKLSFVAADKCEIAISSSSHSIEYQPWSEYMVEAGLEFKDRKSNDVEDHQIRFNIIHKEWVRNHPEDVDQEGDSGGISLG